MPASMQNTGHGLASHASIDAEHGPRAGFACQHRCRARDTGWLRKPASAEATANSQARANAKRHDRHPFQRCPAFFHTSSAARAFFIPLSSGPYVHLINQSSHTSSCARLYWCHRHKVDCLHEHNAVAADHLAAAKRPVPAPTAQARHTARRIGTRWVRESEARHCTSAARTYNHPEAAPLGGRDDLDGLVQHQVHERVVAAQDAHDLAGAVELDCKRRVHTPSHSQRRQWACGGRTRIVQRQRTGHFLVHEPA